MTARYAQLFDTTVRQAFEVYCSGRVNTSNMSARGALKSRSMTNSCSPTRVFGD